ncbi:hypothetical protein [Cytophaga sp. FL35]|uniref:hypothetical protein n=1 Tax=Cytophaga sp. FL35 TaxID=1904456 RepID=UPI001653DB03|nr:hypothetical protein [Cytophaga sp. FL35]MBC7000823.1 hypothetical protein [Cytophaga sp. FL35]
MELTVTLLAAITGTAIMTLYSQLLEVLVGLKLNEAHLLNRLFSNTHDGNTSLNDNNYRGWLIHFLIGFFMSLGLHFLYLCQTLPKTLLMGGIFGLLAGLIGVVGWCAMISSYGKPKGTKLSTFYMQLIGAHVVFGLVNYSIFSMFS